MKLVLLSSEMAMPNSPVIPPAPKKRKVHEVEEKTIIFSLPDTILNVALAKEKGPKLNLSSFASLSFSSTIQKIFGVGTFKGNAASVEFSLKLVPVESGGFFGGCMPLSFIPEKARVLTALTSPELGAFEPSFLEPNENVVEAKEKSKLMSLTKEEYMERTPSEFSNELEIAANLPDPESLLSQMDVFEVRILIFDLKTLYKEALKEKFGNAIGKELVRALF
ncbi:uncharacterized protein LOC135347967 isoform X2 [Halichondria panicea]|uniref:uncharacterized protein LOC135347967 isoform X2 n=1 Tax=Halichondria panicea TaxID=6063 RepID=UPI00312BC441